VDAGFSATEAAASVPGSVPVLLAAPAWFCPSESSTMVAEGRTISGTLPPRPMATVLCVIADARRGCVAE